MSSIKEKVLAPLEEKAYSLGYRSLEEAMEAGAVQMTDTK